MTVPTQPCPATKRNGQICNSTRISQSGFCFAHDPEAIEWRRMGGIARQQKLRESKIIRDGRLDSMVDSLREALNELSSQPATPNNTRAMARLADTIAQIIYRTPQDKDDQYSPITPPESVDY